MNSLKESNFVFATEQLLDLGSGPTVEADSAFLQVLEVKVIP